MLRQNATNKKIPRRQESKSTLKLPPLTHKASNGGSPDFELHGANIKKGTRPHLPSISPVASPRKEKKGALENGTAQLSKNNLLNDIHLKPLPAVTTRDQSIHVLLQEQEIISQPLETEHGGKSVKDVLSEMRRREASLTGEFQIAQADDDVTKQAILLQQLGDVYSNLAKHGKDDMDIIKAVTLYNAALRRCTHQTQPDILSARLASAVQIFLDSKSIRPPSRDKLNTHAKHQETSNKIRKKLQQTNTNIFDKYKEIYVPKDGESDKRKREESLINDVKKMSNMLNNDINNLLKTIWQECTSVIGRPPCSYCFVGLGDHARRLSSPYSSIEYIILVEHGKEGEPAVVRYFTNAVLLFNIKILNLSETPLTASGMQLFNDFYNKRLECFLDGNMVNGMKIDHGRRCPAVSPMHLLKENNNITSPTIFLQSPLSLSQYLTSEGHKVLDTNAFDSFMSATYIEGEISLMRDYESHIRELLRSWNTQDANQQEVQNPVLTVGQTHGASLLIDLVKPHVHSEAADVCSQVGNLGILLETKKCIYEFGKLIHGIGLHYNIAPSDPWKVLDYMVSRDDISSDDAHHLRVALSNSVILRIHSNLINKGCQGINRLLTHNKTREMLLNFNINNILQINDDGPVLRFFYTVIPLVSQLYQGNKSNGEIHGISLTNLYVDDDYTKAQIYMKFLQYKEAITSLSPAQREQNEISTKTLQELCETQAHLGFLYLLDGQSKEANNCFTKLLELKEELEDPDVKSFYFMRTWYYFGALYYNDGKYEKCLSYLRESLDMHKDIFGETQHRDFICRVHHLLGRVHCILGRFKDAIEHLNIVYEDVDHVEGSDKCSPRAYTILSELADAYSNLTEYKTAHTYARQALVIRRNGHGTNTADPWIAHSLRQLGQLSNRFGKYETGALYIKQSLIMKLLICGKEAMIKDEATDEATIEVLCYLVDLATTYESVGVSEGACRIVDHVEGAINSKIGHSVSLPLNVKVQYCQGRAYASLNMNEEALSKFTGVKKTISKMFSENTLSPILAECLEQMAAVSISLGSYPEATDLCEEALSVSQALTGEQRFHPNMASILHRLATIHVRQSDYVKAVDFHMQAIDAHRHVYGHKKPHPDVAKSMRCVALVYILQNDYKHAVSYLNQSLSELYKCYGQDKAHPQIATVLGDIGHCYFKLDELKKAEKSLLCVLQIREELYGASTPNQETFTALMNIGDLYIQVKRHGDAIPFHKRALDMSTYLNKTSQLRAAWMLGKDCAVCKQYTSAQEMFKQAMEIKKSLLGPDNVDVEVAEIMSDLALCYEQLHDRKRASQLQKESLEVRRKVLGPDAVDENMIASMLVLAAEQEDKGNHDKAASLFKQVIHKSRQLKSNDVTNHDVTAAMHGLIAIYNKLGEFEKAHAYSKQLLELLQRMYRKIPDHPSIALCLRKYATAYEGLGHFDKSVEYISQSLEMLKRIHKNNPKSSEITICLGDFGYALFLSGQPQQGLEKMKSALNSLRENARRTKKDREDIAELLYKMGEASEDRETYQQSIDYYTESLKIRKELNSGKSHNLEVAQSLRGLGRAYAAAQNYDKAILYMEDALRMEKSSKRSSGAYHITATALIDLGSVYDKNGSPEKAMRVLSDALRMLKQIHNNGKASLYVAHCLTALASVSRKAKQYDNAIQFCHETIEIYKQIYNQNMDHPVVANTYGMLGELYLEAGQFTEAVSYIKQSTRMLLAIHDDGVSNPEVQGMMKLLERAKKSLAV